MNLHNEIMNLPCPAPRELIAQQGQHNLCYKFGHRDARHAAAELAIEADKRIEDLEYALKELVQALPINRDWLDPDIERLARHLLKDVK